MRLRSSLILFACGFVFAQSATSPVRSVPDPGIVTTRQQITPAGTPAVFRGRVYGIAFGADPTEVWVLQSNGVYRMDWKQNTVKKQNPLEGRPGLQGIVFQDGKARVAYADKQKKVRLLSIGSDSESGSAALGDLIAGSPAVGGNWVVVPLTSENKLAILRDGQLLGHVQTGIAPFAAVTDGNTAYVSNWGGRPPTLKDRSAPTGRASDADQVLIDKQGIAASGTVTHIDLQSMKPIATIPTGLHPTGVAWDRKASRLYVANNNSDTVSVIDTQSDRIIRTIPIQPFAKPVAGIAPTALAISPDGSRLYVACGGINAVAVVTPATGKIVGTIPTAWYPNALSISSDGRWLAVSALLGSGPGGRESPTKRWVFSDRGSIAVIAVPDEPQLASWTTAVAENNRMNATSPTAADQKPPRPRPIPFRSGDPSPIEHVVYIIKENRTYDQVFGDMPKGNGDPSLTMFGADVTPNQHRLADEFVLLDNFYATGGNSADGHQWALQANEVAYCLWPGYVGRSYPYDGSDPLAISRTGFIWDLAAQRNRSVRVYGEYAPYTVEPAKNREQMLAAWKSGESFGQRWHTTSPIPPLDRVLARNYPSYSTSIPDVVRARIFLKDLESWGATGSMPNLVIVQLPSDHTNGTAPNASSPKAMVADNDYALGQIVEGLSKSRFWPKMAIFVVEDDAQNGVDHVDGHRTVALAVSPYSRHGQVDSTFYSHQSILKTVELILGLPTLSLFDLIANDMRASFTEKPDARPWQAVLPTQSLEERNPPLAALRGAERKGAQQSAKMHWHVPDAVPTERLNRILWRSIRGAPIPYPGSRKAVFVPYTVDTDDEDDK